MDGVLCNFSKRVQELRNDVILLPQTTYGFYTSLEPMPGAIEAYKWLVEQGHDVRILTAPSVKNPLCYTEKRIWIETNLGMEAVEKAVLSCDKTILIGDILIDDRIQEGAEGTFKGKFILFGSDDYPSWDSVLMKYDEEF
jgi:5'(3')-deoxyribonucleotidase